MAEFECSCGSKFDTIDGWFTHCAQCGNRGHDVLKQVTK